MNNHCHEHLAPEDCAAASDAWSAPDRKPVHADYRVIAALVVALLSAVSLAAFDKPMDRSSFTPSVLEVGVEQSAVKPVTNEHPKAHAMLLRYEFAAPHGTVWHAGMPQPEAPNAVRAQPLLL